MSFPSSTPGQPVWALATLYPPQGEWAEADYLALQTNHLVEFADGFIEVLPVPSDRHQAALLYLVTVVLAYAQRHGATLRFAPLRVRLWPGRYREPDLMLMTADHAHRRHDSHWDGADLVMEVVSPDDRARDTELKRVEYARAGIPEYWLVDLEREAVVVLRLEGEAYAEHGVFPRGTSARSAHYAGLAVEVTALLDAR